MSALRKSPPQRIGASPIVRTLDGMSGEEVLRGERRPSGLPSADLVAFQSEDGSRLTARPSGTEPKIKFYLELVGQAKDPEAVAATRGGLDAECRKLKAALLKELELA
jgi:phosphoglucomutase